MSHKLIKIKEAAEILGVSKLTLRNWDKSGKLVAFRHPMNNYRVYNSEDIDQVIRKIQSGEKPVKAPRTPKVKTITDYEKPKFYKLRVKHL